MACQLAVLVVSQVVAALEVGDACRRATEQQARLFGEGCQALQQALQHCWLMNNTQLTRRHVSAASFTSYWQVTIAPPVMSSNRGPHHVACGLGSALRHACTVSSKGRSCSL